MTDLEKFDEALEQFEKSKQVYTSKGMGSDADKEIVEQAFNYMNGFGNYVQDLEKAVSLFQQAAQRGHMGAQYALGELYYYEQGTDTCYKNDIEKSIYWFKEAAKQGYANAQRFLGIIYFYGMNGARKNLTKAKYWFKKAADQGDDLAWERLHSKSFSDMTTIVLSIIVGITLGSIMVSAFGFLGFVGGAIAGWLIVKQIRIRF